ncbi:hypothetical protein KKE06_03585 [Candidatus Micrarchaeota archaeon]|nr:hypothetical protein [Candidatus Micrarchaeota archaeon]MBU1930949.1 hypothetical protein [Candidatus Micrarchaeota archaeon]
MKIFVIVLMICLVFGMGCLEQSIEPSAQPLSIPPALSPVEPPPVEPAPENLPPFDGFPGNFEECVRAGGLKMESNKCLFEVLKEANQEYYDTCIDLGGQEIAIQEPFDPIEGEEFEPGASEFFCVLYFWKE